MNNPDHTQDLFDWEVPIGPEIGLFTRYFHEASSGNFIVLADHLLAPDNGGIFRFTSNATSPGAAASVSSAVAAVNQALGTSIITGHGLTSIDDFDLWTISSTGTSGPGLPKVTPSTESPRKYDHVMFIWRNASGAASGYGVPGGSPGALLGYGANSYTSFGAWDRVPIAIMRHEFAHFLFGPNRFHYAGGGDGATGRYWISQSGGWGALGLYNSSLQSWSAWDRLQLGWKAPGQLNDIAARNESNSAELNGDLDPFQIEDAGVYVLRDFVAKGDALRIKVPYTDPVAEYPEFIWVENHQGRNLNNNPFDCWQYEDAECVIDVEPGLYMYMQIDREVRQAATATELYGGYEEFARPLSASGAWDLRHPEQPWPSGCVGGGDNMVYERIAPNPLTGVSDTHFSPLDADNNGVLGNEARLQGTQLSDGNYQYNLFHLGHARHGFTPGGNRKLGVGTNPTSASMLNTVGFNTSVIGAKNHRRIQLNGISIELLAQNPDGSITVQVRFDDVDIANDTRWCADEIVLNPVPTANGHSLNVTAGNTILLDRGTTATRRTDPLAFNGHALFTSPTVMRCTDQSWFNLESNSEVVVDNGSTLRMESGSRLDVGDGAVLRVRHGSKLELLGGSALNILLGGKVIIEEGEVPQQDGQLVYETGARINIEADAADAGELEIAGSLSIAAGATFTIGQASDASMTRGRLRFSNSRTPSNNVVAGSNSRFILQSNHQFRPILHVDQESLYGPVELQEFALLKASALLAPGARIVPPVTNSCEIRFEDARVSAPGQPNGHRGVRLNGQQQVTLKRSRFERGEFGVYAFNPTLGHVALLDECLFTRCGIGYYGLGKGVAAYRSTFTDCKTGLMAEQVSLTSKLVECVAGGNTTGVFVQGSASLLVIDPDFDHNANGLVLEGMDARVECGTISNNSVRGIHMKYAATLRMNGSAAFPHDPVTAIGNPTTISCLQANNLFLNLGYNSLRPSSTGIGKTMNGTFLCQPYLTQRAYRNNWEGTSYAPLTSAEYVIVTSCPNPVPVVFVDPFGAPQTPCGQAIPPCPNPPCWEPEFDALLVCPDCREVETTELGEVGLHVASLEAKLLAEDDSLPGNEKLAIALAAEILLNDMDSLNADEAHILGMDYSLLKEGMGDALAKGQFSDSGSDLETDAYLALVDSVFTKRLSEASADSLYELRLFTAIDRAQTHRAAGKHDLAVALFEDMLLWVGPVEEAWVARLACLTALERDVTAGMVSWDEVEALMDACIPSEYKSLASAADSENANTEIGTRCPVGIGPDAGSYFSSVNGFKDEQTRMAIMDVTGREVWGSSFSGQKSIPAQSFATGSYQFYMLGTNGSFCTGRVSLVK
ncbi:MAG TPA: hypothetical protein PKY96_03220 [Flavobacteriales bacterium]|nr:hypothetical protein [Flavobacteriales bacterium]